MTFWSILDKTDGRVVIKKMIYLSNVDKTRYIGLFLTNRRYNGLILIKQMILVFPDKIDDKLDEFSLN